MDGVELAVEAMQITHNLTDRARILAFLETDRLYAAYAVADLEPGFFEQCTWAVAGSGGQLQALALLFQGLDPPALFLMGAEDGLHAILEARRWPERVYLTCRSDHLPLSRRYFDWDATIPMWRMVLRPQGFTPVRGHCVRLTAHHLERLQALYGLGGGGAFTLAQLKTGIFCGVFVGDDLVAAAGTHIVSQTYGVAAVGNVSTHQEHRKRGFGAQVTSAVVEELLAAKIPDIVLNVAQDNRAAIAIYERLGFEHYCPFFEGPASAL